MHVSLDCWFRVQSWGCLTVYARINPRYAKRKERLFKYDANTCGKSHCNFKLTNINPDVLHSPHEVVGELGRGHNYWNVFQAVFEWKSTGGDNRKDKVFRLEFGGSKICNKSRLWRFQMSKSIGQSESLRHWLGKGRMGCSMPVRKGLRKPGWRQIITWSVFLHLFCLDIFSW